MILIADESLALWVTGLLGPTLATICGVGIMILTAYIQKRSENHQRLLDAKADEKEIREKASVEAHNAEMLRTIAKDLVDLTEKVASLQRAMMSPHTWPCSQEQRLTRLEERFNNVAEKVKDLEDA